MTKFCQAIYRLYLVKRSAGSSSETDEQTLACIIVSHFPGLRAVTENSIADEMRNPVIRLLDGLLGKTWNLGEWQKSSAGDKYFLPI